MKLIIKVMEQLIAAETNPTADVAIFAAYSLGGVTALSYVAFRSFRTVSQKTTVRRPAGQRLSISHMGSTGGLIKGIAALGVYLTGFALLAWRLNLNDRVFQSCIQKDKDYMAKVKLDPFYQDFYIINTMRYFGISDKLIERTQAELKEKIAASPAPQQSTAIGLEKSMMALAQMISPPKK